MAHNKLPLWRRIRRRAYWLLLVCLLNLAGLLPIKEGRRLGVLLARLALKIRPEERSQALRNIQLVYPEMDQQAVECLLTESTVTLGSNFFDILMGHKLLAQDSWVMDEAAFLADQEPLVEVIARLKKENKGVLLLSGHLGAWELSGGALARLWQEKFSEPLDLSVVTGTVHNPAVNRLLQNRRRKLGVKILPRDEGIKPLLAALDRGGVVAVLLDQNTSVHSLPVSFFGHDAPTASGFARIALMRGCPVLPVVMASRGKGHVIRYLPALDPQQFLGDEENIGRKQQIDFLAACNRMLEELILRNPQQWIWFHNRWALDSGKTGKEQVKKKEMQH